jgi:PBP1b-binding outer membrane lipoprotein LpoB
MIPQASQVIYSYQMTRFALILSLAMLLTSCGENAAEKQWKQCSNEVSQMPYDPEAQANAQAICNAQYESSTGSVE